MSDVGRGELKGGGQPSLATATWSRQPAASSMAGNKICSLLVEMAKMQCRNTIGVFSSQALIAFLRNMFQPAFSTVLLHVLGPASSCAPLEGGRVR